MASCENCGAASTAYSGKYCSHECDHAANCDGTCCGS